MNYPLLDTLRKKKVALVLSGGVVKASAWHLGVALALDDLGIILKGNKQKHAKGFQNNQLEISTYVGSSAGSLVGIFLSSGFSPQEIVSSTLSTSTKSGFKAVNYRDMFYFRPHKLHSKNGLQTHFFEGLPKIFNFTPLSLISGFFSTEGLKKYLLNSVLSENTFESFLPDLFIVATQLDHSRKVVFSRYSYPNPTHDNTTVYYTGIPVADACAASMSVPPFYRPYPIYNPQTGQVDYYIDGEIRDTLSSHVAEDNGCDVIISSWTHTPYHFHDEIGSLVNFGLPVICVQAIYLMIQKKIISTRAKRATDLDIISSVNEYMVSQNFSVKDRRNITSILEKKLHFKRKTKYIDIYPHFSDNQTFFSNSFSLNPKIMEKTLQAGYDRTLEIFKSPE